MLAVLLGGIIIIGLIALYMESFFNSLLFIFLGGTVWAILVLAVDDSMQKEKYSNLLEQAVKNSGYNDFNTDFRIGYGLYIDKNQKLIAVLHNEAYIIFPAYALKDISHQIIYDYKTESNVSKGQALADGMLAGITGVGIIREIGEKQVQYIKEIKLKLGFNLNGYFTKEISTDITTATNFLELVPSLKEGACKPQKTTKPTAIGKVLTQTTLKTSTSPVSETQNSIKVNKETWKTRISQAMLKKSDEKVSALLEVAMEGSARAYNLLGLHYSSLNDFQSALHYYELAYDIEPNNMNILNNLGFLYAQEGFYGFDLFHAMTYFKKSGLDIAYHNMGGIYDGTLGGKKDSRYINYDLAIYCYEKALNMGYDTGTLLNNLGALYGDKKRKYVIAASFCFLSGKQGHSTGKNNYNTYKEKISEEVRNIWIRNIEMLSSHKEIEGMLQRVSSTLNIEPETIGSNYQDLPIDLNPDNISKYNKRIIQNGIREAFKNESYADDRISFSIRDELAILESSNNICISKTINDKTYYYIVSAFDVCSYRKSNGKIFLSFKYDGEQPDTEVDIGWPGRVTKVFVATPEESEYLFSHIKNHLSVNKIDYFN